MKLLFLRGKADRKGEIAFKSIEDENDTWTHLAYAMTGPQDTTKVLYWGGHRKVYYSDNFSVCWVDSLKHYSGMNPDTIIARGGFDEYVPILREFRNVLKVYYGANHGCIPKDGIKYNLILCDSPAQKAKAEKHGYRAELFFKSAPPSFSPREVEKKYDCLLSAIWPADARKNVRWVYKTIPRNLKVLQLGHSPKFAVPRNVTVKNIAKRKVPKAISKCRVVIAPYKAPDSCPRIVPESLACGVPVVALNKFHIWREKYQIAVTNKAEFWRWVKTYAKNSESLRSEIREFYLNNLSVEKAGQHLRGVIEGIRNG
jgi:hypothetical protein